MTIQSNSHRKILEQSHQWRKKLSYSPSIQPVDNKNLRRLSGGFGMRIHPTIGLKIMHYGQDFAIKAGNPVYATACGTVQIARYSRSAGNIIQIKHGPIFNTRYLHLKKMFVKPGQRVYRGQKIGLSGATGERCAGAHLHYEILKFNKHVDPIDYFYGELTPEQYEKVRILAKRDLMSMD